MQTHKTFWLGTAALAASKTFDTIETRSLLDCGEWENDSVLVGTRRRESKRESMPLSLPVRPLCSISPSATGTPGYAGPDARPVNQDCAWLFLLEESQDSSLIINLGDVLFHELISQGSDSVSIV